MTAARTRHNRRPGRSSSQLCRPTTRRRIYARDGHHCVWCGCAVGRTRLNLPSDATLDHLVPRVQGGCNRYWNLVTACRACNFRRRDMPAVAFAHCFRNPSKVALRVLAAVSLPLPEVEA
jgi:5-methylcytosine-specific restriction endonuclease McrA